MSYIQTSVFSIVTKTTTYTILANDSMILGDTTSAAFVLTLPTAVGRAGKEYIIKNIGVNNLTIDGNASETIDGALTKILTNKWASVNIISDNANWNIF